MGFDVVSHDWLEFRQVYGFDPQLFWDLKSNASAFGRCANPRAAEMLSGA